MRLWLSRKARPERSVKLPVGQQLHFTLNGTRVFSAQLTYDVSPEGDLRFGLFEGDEKVFISGDFAEMNLDLTIGIKFDPLEPWRARTR